MMRWFLLCLLTPCCVAQDSVLSWYNPQGSAPISFSNSVFVVNAGFTNKLATGSAAIQTNFTLVCESNIANAWCVVAPYFYAGSGTEIDAGVRINFSGGSLNTNFTLLYSTNFLGPGQIVAGIYAVPLGNLLSNHYTITISNEHTFDALMVPAALYHNVNQTNPPSVFSEGYRAMDGTDNITNIVTLRTNDYDVSVVWQSGTDADTTFDAWYVNDSSAEHVISSTYLTAAMGATLFDTNHVTSATNVFQATQVAVPNPTWTIGFRAIYLTNSPTIADAAWVDAIAPGSTTSDDDSSDTTILVQDIVADQTGNCTKLRIYSGSSLATVNGMKMALYNTSNALLSSGSVSSGSGANAWTEVTITSQAVTSGSTYRIGWLSQSVNDYRYRYAASGGTFRYNFSGSYGSFPPNPFTEDGNGTRSYAVGMYIEP